MAEDTQHIINKVSIGTRALHILKFRMANLFDRHADNSLELDIAGAHVSDKIIVV